MTYSMKCSCGQVMTVDGDNRDQAVTKMKAMMTQGELDKHMTQFHKPDEPKPTLEQAHAMIEQTLVEGNLNETLPSN